MENHNFISASTAVLDLALIFSESPTAVLIHAPWRSVAISVSRQFRRYELNGIPWKYSYSIDLLGVEENHKVV
ncbi:unnamed protein product [Acidithrix sp. C25]|nr:unnamed protein product [Acidithrix sp. C25]